ncbi:unnamed protein product [Ciceribacter sp. T2.26MG-112.2]|nr:unnamed protein product [Ciceribacter naphthalenivorans]
MQRSPVDFEVGGSSSDGFALFAADRDCDHVLLDNLSQSDAGIITGRDDVALFVRHGDVDSDPRVFRGECGKEWSRKERFGDRGRCNPQYPTGPALSANRFKRSGNFRQWGRERFSQPLARFGQSNGARCSHHQCRTVNVFQAANPLADGGSGHPEAVGCRPKVMFFSNGEEQRQKVKVGHNCPVLLIIESMIEWLHEQGGRVHFGHANEPFIREKERQMGKTVLITGASSGIGEGIARELGASGANVLLGARRCDRIEKIASDIRSAGGVAETRALDVTDRLSVAAFAAAALSMWGRIDVLVNNAGIMPLSPLAAGMQDEWERMVDVNIKGVLWGIGAVLPVMEAQGEGHQHRIHRRSFGRADGCSLLCHEICGSSHIRRLASGKQVRSGYLRQPRSR